MARPTAEQRYEAKIDRSGGPNACHEWKALRDRNGYGKFRDGTMWIASRWGYSNYVGAIHDDLVVRHSCGNPACQNTEHLLLGTRAEASTDMVGRGRQAHPKGESCGMAKLTEADVLMIREMSLSGTTRKDIAAKFGVSGSLISRILSGKYWSHLLPSLREHDLAQ